MTVVDDLQNAGLIERSRNPADRRSYLVAPTASGTTAHQYGQRLVRHAERALLGALDQQERRTLTDLLARAMPPRMPSES